MMIAFPLVLFLVVMMPGLSLAQEGWVVSAHPVATKAGQAVLDEGGNAFDAAVAVSATLSVVEPAGSGIGGGGFWLLYEAQKDRSVMVDAREVAPGAAHADMFLNEAGEAEPSASREGPLSAGIPGQIAAYQHMVDHYASLPLDRLLEPAITAAQEGVVVDARMHEGLAYKAELMRRYPQAASIYLRDQEALQEGDLLIQADLGKTLRAVARDGAEAFYTGPVAQAMVNAVRENGGIWTMQDLATYRVIEREPEIFLYHDSTITAASLPSSGGLVLKEALGILEGFDLQALGPITRAHVIVEALRRAYRDRALYMGDPDFLASDVPTPDIPALRSSIDLTQATSSAELGLPDGMGPDGGTQTTHFAVMDRSGNRVAVTQSINFWFGSGFVAGDTGVLLNNEMDDFIVAPGVENGYGLIGTQANAIAPGKRMLSSMTPVFVEQGEDVAVIGTPGGSRIISMNLLAILDFLSGKSADAIVAAPRFHHQFYPDKIVYEQGAFTPDIEQGLKALGHTLSPRDRPYGNMQLLLQKQGQTTTASDPRGMGGGSRIY